MASMRLAVKDLYPFERQCASGKVARHKRTFRRRKKLKPVKVLNIDGDWLVIDGCNRVMAAAQEGFEEIEAAEEIVSDRELPRYREALDEAKALGQQGFENVPMGGVGERAHLYAKNQPSVIDGLLERLQSEDGQDSKDKKA